MNHFVTVENFALTARLLVGLFFAGLLSALPSTADGDEDYKTKILAVFPQADANEDGELSTSEEKAVYRRILQRYPQVDKDGDGSLSEKEKQSLLRMAENRMAANRMAENRAKRGQPANPGSNTSGSRNSAPNVLLEKLGLKSERDIEYRENTEQQKNRLDFIYPKTDVYEKAPLFIYIHGGGNTGGSKSAIYNQGALILKELTEAGIAVASIDYRLFGKGEELGFQQLFQDCKDALRFLARNSERFGVDPHKFVTWGTSAGGSKALITALTETDFLPGEVTGPGTEHTVIGSISFYGGTTYVVEDVWNKRRKRFPTSSQSKTELMFKPNNGLSTVEIQRLVSADLHLKSDSPPILLVHGDTDPTVPIEVSKHLYQLGKKKGSDVKLTEVANAGHGLKSVKGNPAQPSMTWDEAQLLVVRQVLAWVQ